MKRSLTCFACLLFLVAVPCLGAEISTVTLLFGQPKLLRGTSWFNLKEGVRLRDGDVIDLPQAGQLQLEFTDGGTVSVIGPGALYIVAATARDAKQPGSAEFLLTRGWLKFETKPPAPRLRIRTAQGTIATSEAAAVVHAGDGFEAFVETGTARLSDVGKLEIAGGEIKGGGFASRPAGKPLAIERRPPAQFVAALPRDFMDPLPVRLTRFASIHVDPVADHESTFAEAQPWLSGSYRGSFLKRFQARLDDPAFRDAMASSGKAPPEWNAAAAPPPKAEAAPPPPPPPAAKAEPERTFRWPWEKSGK
ncbi:MAG: hypothetical protein ABI900_03350 [Betaproteobacteria bacterium]